MSPPTTNQRPLRLVDLELDLEVFAGPFDLLLTLILREEVDILEVDLADVVISYIDYLEARGELSFWPKAWCQSFRVSCLAPWPLRAWQTPRQPPDCRVLVFHGEPKPPEALTGRPGWGQTFRPAPWIADYWQE